MKINVNVTENDVKLGMKYALTPDRDPIARAITRSLRRNGIQDAVQLTWGGELWVGGNLIKPDGLKRMPNCFGGLSRRHRRYLRRPRKFNFEYKG